MHLQAPNHLLPEIETASVVKAMSRVGSPPGRTWIAPSSSSQMGPNGLAAKEQNVLSNSTFVSIDRYTAGCLWLFAQADAVAVFPAPAGPVSNTT